MRPESLRTLRILWAAMLASSTMFILVLVQFSLQGRKPPEPIGMLLPVLGVAALLCAALSVVVPKLHLARSLRSRQLAVEDRPADERMFADEPRRARVFVDPKAALTQASAAYQAAVLLGLALAESLAAYGFMVVFLGFSWVYAVPFFAVCWVLMASKIPTERAPVTALQNAYDADLDLPADDRE